MFNVPEGGGGMSLHQIRQGLYRIYVTWKKEAGYRTDKKNPGTSFLDGVVFGLKLAVDYVDKCRRDYR
jgi:hypothetical protein